MPDVLIPSPSPVKPGPQTSEFWQTLLTNVLAIVVALTTLLKVNFEPSGWVALIPAIAVLAAAIVSGFYSHSRAVVKAAASTTGQPVNDFSGRTTV